MVIFDDLMQRLDAGERVRRFGRISGVSGLVLSCQGLDNTAIGSRCRIEDTNGEVKQAEVVGYKNGETLLMPFGTVDGIGPGCRVYATSTTPAIEINNSYIGRVINALGEPIDGLGPISSGGTKQLLKASPPMASKRAHVGAKLDVGVRSINTFVPICKGQRMGIFSGSGVGKSVLMSMVAKYSEADVNVIAMVGERGREVREFIDQQLGAEGLAKSVVIVSTSDEPPLMRRQAAYMAMAVAEYFRDCNFDVMMLMDSVTRFAFAQREIGLSAGEPPTTRGFTPSVFSELPRLLERAGTNEGAGTITGIFTVLVEGGDMDEPVADAVRGILDGHIILSRELAERGHFPSIDILKSVSRMVPQCNSRQENELINETRSLLATYVDMEELIRLGAYQKGSNPAVDNAIAYQDDISMFLRQSPSEHNSLAEGFKLLERIISTDSKSSRELK